jgi:hypothetical protein
MSNLEPGEAFWNSIISGLNFNSYDEKYLRKILFFCGIILLLTLGVNFV